jgi:DNA-binding transcriptional ArsR family regulator
MTNPFESLAGLDRLVHEPARLAILTALAGVAEADFLFLERLTGLSRGNLSAHLTKLADGGLVDIIKQFQGRKPVTLLRLTPLGREAIDRHWAQLADLRRRSTEWPAAPTPARSLRARNAGDPG